MSDTIVRTPEETAVLNIIDGVYRSWVANDADTFVAEYDPDATTVGPGNFTVGREAARLRMAAAFAGPLHDSHVLDEVQNIRFPNPDTAIVVSRSAVVMAGESDVPEDRWGVATWVMIRRDGRWLLTSHQYTAG
ncbi:SgcJ/EcaC family oxidoreductase [Nocardia sp. NPDC020380]|uniref:SgcJ/EcaC family oxidoreductase n=1 Tax=Nocardia sp. NPDC020380 TaxID=3364309 RepID=UPI00378BE0EA